MERIVGKTNSYVHTCMGVEIIVSIYTELKGSSHILGFVYIYQQY